jgi:hypothetical protein
MTCPRCWHIIGEYLLCRDHGGGNCWSKGAPKSPNLDAPPEPVDINDPWFDFLNTGKKVVSEVTP